MSDILDLIFSEIDSADAAADALRARANNANRQTNLEVAILEKQLAEQSAKNARAREYIDKATGIIEKLKTTGAKQ